LSAIVKPSLSQRERVLKTVIIRQAVCSHFQIAGTILYGAEPALCLRCIHGNGYCRNTAILA